MFNNKKIRFSIILATILYANITMAKDNAKENANQQIISWVEPAEIMEKQLAYFDNYWHRLLNNKFHNGHYSLHNKFIVQDKQYLMILEIPGFDKEQVKIKLNGNYLVVNGDLRKENKEKNSKDYQYLEQNNFNFSFMLNEDIDKKNITSSLKNGVLTIILPRLDIKNVESKEITIN